MANDVKLLLVDDNPMVLGMLEHALASFARVVSAGDSADAVSFAAPTNSTVKSPPLNSVLRKNSQVEG